MSPSESEDLTGVVVKCGEWFAVLWSPDTAEHCPSYEELGRFKTRKRAKAFLDRRILAASERVTKNPALGS
jgi:hypothetical protein